MLVQQLLKQRRVTIPSDNDHRLLWPIPALMERLQHLRSRGAQRLGRADRCTVGQTLTGKEQFACGILYFGLRTSAFPQFRQHHGALRIDRGCTQSRRPHHARQNFQAFVEAGFVGVGQVQFVDGLGRCGFGIAVAAKCRAQTLPDALGLAIRDVGRTTKCKMLHEMGESLLRVGFHQRSDI